MQKEIVILPHLEKKLRKVGEQIKLARLRRRISMELACERAGISRTTLWKIENGDPTVAFGYYALVLMALNGLDDDLLLIAKDDELGRKLQDMELLSGKRVRK